MKCVEALMLLTLAIIVFMTLIGLMQFSWTLLILSIINSLIGVMLVIAVFKIRNTIKSQAFAHPKEKLVIIHTVNFVVWLALMWSFNYYLIEVKDKMREFDRLKFYKVRFGVLLLEIVKINFEVYIDVFLTYLVYRFAQESSHVE